MPRRRRRNDTPPTPIADALFQPPSANPRLLSDLVSSPVGPLTEVEDRRTYHPLDTFRPVMEIGGTPSGPRQVKRSFKRSLPFGLQFGKPEKTAICVRRNTRKEVLHAMRKTGKGGGPRRRPRRNWHSSTSC